MDNLWAINDKFVWLHAVVIFVELTLKYKHWICIHGIIR